MGQAPEPLALLQCTGLGSTDTEGDLPMAMREPAPFETVVPVIDIAALFGADAAAKSAVARRIAAACR